MGMGTNFINSLNMADPVNCCLLNDEFACKILEQMDSGNGVSIEYDDPYLGHIKVNESTIMLECANYDELEAATLQEISQIDLSVSQSHYYDSVEEEVDDFCDAEASLLMDDGYGDLIDIVMAHEDVDYDEE